MHRITDLAVLIPLLALISYVGLFLVVVISKPQTTSKKAFLWYLFTMLIWSLTALVVMTESGDTFFWFKAMSSAAVISMVGMFQFIQTMVVKKVKWGRWVYIYAILAVVLTLYKNLTISTVWFENGILNFSFTPLLPLVAGPGYILTIINIVMLYRVYREAKDVLQRNRFRYLLLGLALIPIGSITNFTPLGRYPIDIAANAIAALLISYAILRHQLLDITLVIRRSLLYAIPTIIISAGYFLIIELALSIFQGFTGLQVFSLSIVVAILTALVVQPFRDLAQAWIDKLFFRERYDSGRMLQRVSQTASTVINLNKLTSMILKELSQTMHVKKAALFLKSSEHNDFRLVAQIGKDLPQSFFLKADNPLLNWLEKNPLPLTWQELNTKPWFKSLWGREIEAFKKIGVELIIPLRAESKLLGVLALSSKKSDQAYVYEDQATLMTLCNNISVAIQNAQLFTLSEKELAERRKAEKQLQLQLRRLSALQHINIAIATTVDLQVPLLLLLEQAIKELQVDAADVLLYNPNTRCLEYAAGRGFKTDALMYTSLHVGQGLAGHAAKEKRIIHIENLNKIETSLVNSPLISKEKLVVYFGVPLITKGEIKGVLEIFHRSPMRPTDEWLDFLNTLASETAIAIDNAQLFEGLKQSNIDLSEAYETTLEGWASTLELRDQETEGHSRRVIKLTMQLAKKMNVNEEKFIHIQRGTLLHDIGKLGVPDSVLLKPGPLSDEEWEKMRRHPVYAKEMLSTIPFLKPAMDIPYCHHEKWDGTGYPRGIKGKKIPLPARIFSIVDVFDALLSDRPYRNAWKEEDALVYIKEQSGKYFDPNVVDAFMQLIEETQKERDQ
jgi:HD-GYP domain-containing protein (c-di-GMP phosphodiesterase class II)